MAKNAHVQSGHRALKLTVSQKNFACWCKFRNAIIKFNVFWVGMVKNGQDHLVHETLKSTAS